MSLRLLAVAALALGLAGCRAHLQQRLRAHVETEAGAFVFEYTQADRESRAHVEEAIRVASPKLRQWGGLREPVHVFILPSHDDLEAAVNRGGYDWLRAWARYDEIFLQSPRTWGLFGAQQGDVNELMLHELTHSVMYQQAADRTHWSRKGIPLWFREGMASYTAGQGYRWPTLEDLARFYDEQRDHDPVGHPDPLYQDQSAIVYGAAHHAFTFLVHRYGQDRVREVLVAMRSGRSFREAFAGTLGLSHEAFVADFKRYVTLRGFRGSRLKRLHPARPVQVPGKKAPSDASPPAVEPLPEEAPAPAPSDLQPEPEAPPAPGPAASEAASWIAPGSIGRPVR